MDREGLKRQAGEAAAAQVRDGMVVGLGTGSTVRYTIEELGRRVAQGLRIVGIPTSRQSEDLARKLGIPLGTLAEHAAIDVTIDGADEFDPKLRLIKGGGGALTREKVVARCSQRLVIVADEAKRVDRLGSTFALPVEVVAFAVPVVRRLLEERGAHVTERTKDGRGYVTDNGNPILDARFSAIADPETLERDLELFPGVVCTGLFLGLADEVIVAGATGVTTVRA